jgi:hypothetical protein
LDVLADTLGGILGVYIYHLKTAWKIMKRIIYNHNIRNISTFSRH